MKPACLDLKNTFVIGDVHGCFYTLEKLIKQLPDSAQLVFTGDLCDKGNYSNKVIEFVIQNEYLCVKGNHEHLYETYIIDAIQNDRHSPWSNDKRYGGLKTIQSYDGDFKKIDQHLQWIKTLPIYIEIGKYFITHGFALEFYHEKDNPNQYNNFLLNRLYPDMDEPEISEDIFNIFGHCAFEEVHKGKKYLCLDTGCAKGGKLSAFSLDNGEIFEEKLDRRDSSYSVKELLLQDIELKNFTLEAINKITLKKPCPYASYDVVSNEVLEYILNQYPENAKTILYKMKERSIIFPKQLHKVLNI